LTLGEVALTAGFTVARDAGFCTLGFISTPLPGMLAFAENERDRARASFAASTSSALERGVYLAGKTPIGYVRGPDRRLVPDPDTSPVVVGAVERRAKWM
jgi:hypothetical protein